MTLISLRLPEEVVVQLKQLAPKLGHTGYQPLMRSYILQGLQADQAQLAGEGQIQTFVEQLKEEGVDEAVLQKALAEAHATYEVRVMPKFVTAPEPKRSSETPVGWGALTAALLLSLDTSEWKDVAESDPVRYVESLRAQRRMRLNELS